MQVPEVSREEEEPFRNISPPEPIVGGKGRKKYSVPPVSERDLSQMSIGE